MKLYIYNIDTKEIAEIIEGIDNEECEAKAAEANYDDEQYAWSYTSFGLK